MSLFRRFFIKRNSHHHSRQSWTHILNTYNDFKIINLLGDNSSVDKSSVEINKFIKERQINSIIIQNNDQMLNVMIHGSGNFQIIINKCYNKSCAEIKELNCYIRRITNCFWHPYSLYIMPNAVNRFINCEFVKGCDQINFIYPLAATQDIKRRDINILINK